MRDPSLPAALLCVSIGLMLGFRDRRALLAAAGAMMAAMALAGAMTWTATSEGTLFLCAWLGVATAALCAWLPKGAPAPVAIALATAAGAIMALLGGGRPAGGLFAMAALLMLAGATARLLVTHGRSLFVRVAAGWLLAVAVLNATLTILPVTPGYLPDHTE